MRIIFQTQDGPIFNVQDSGDGRLIFRVTVQGVDHYRALQVHESRELLDALVLSSAMSLQLTPDSKALAEWRQHVAQAIAQLQCDCPDWPGGDV